MRDYYIAIHGHFYQPPRENPWSGIIDPQPSAAPFHNWNERIMSECYLPNAQAELRGLKDKTLKRINNYQNMSFNFGPTLIDWIRKTKPEFIDSLIDADRISSQQCGGHGNAIAQVYNHIIMPLSGHFDQETQIIWGLRHFENTFHRKAEGIWLSETAAGPLTLRLLIDNALKFTILSPTQARKTRKLGEEMWRDVSDNSINPRQPYRFYDCDEYGQKIHSRYIDIFFYDGPISVDISFNSLIRNAEDLGKKILNAYDSTSEKPQLVSLAMDGEVYGHHKKFGEMALAYLYEKVLPEIKVRPVNFARFLEICPPEHEVILKNGPVNLGTAWSCSHGVGRWYRDCGCQTGGGRKWNQRWRTPLREAMNILKQDLDEIFFDVGSRYFYDPRQTRNNYIDVLLEDSPGKRDSFLRENCRESEKAEQEKIWALLEMQRCGMLMFTSCGWFFNDISGIETIQILAYGACAIEKAAQFTDFPLEKAFLQLLSGARSNVTKHKNGEVIYQKFVLPMKT